MAMLGGFFAIALKMKLISILIKTNSGIDEQ